MFNLSWKPREIFDVLARRTMSVCRQISSRVESLHGGYNVGYALIKQSAVVESGLSFHYKSQIAMTHESFSRSSFGYVLNVESCKCNA